MDRYGFREGTFAGASGNDEDAPRADPALGLQDDDRALNAGIRGTLDNRQLASCRLNHPSSMPISEAERK